VITTEPPADVTAGSEFGLVVIAEDRFGNTDPSFAGTVTVGLANNPAGATLGGPTEATASGGLARFGGLTLDSAGTGALLQVSSGGLSSTTTSAITVRTAPASQLVITAQPPGSIASGSGFGLTVTAEDRFGNLATAFNGTMVLTLANNPGGATLGGASSAPASAGLATFGGLTLDRAASGATIEVSSSGLSGATTSTINVSAAPAAQLVIMVQPPASVNSGGGFSLVVLAEDGFGNVDPSFNRAEQVVLAGNPDGATLGGPSTAVASRGMAMFSGLTLDKGGNGYTLQVMSAGLAAAVTDGFSVIAPPVEVLGVSLQNQSIGRHKTTTVIVVQFSDALSEGAAANASAYTLTTVAHGKKHPSRPLALAQASYNAIAHSVTLRPVKKLALNPPVQLQLSASALTDLQGRPLDGNHDGQPGGDFTTTLSNGGVNSLSVSRLTIANRRVLPRTRV